MNKVILKGRTTKDPDIRYSSGENAKAFANFTLAVEDRGWKEGDKFHTDFISCNAVGNVAEVIERNVHKGQELVLVGKWRTSSYEKDGKNIYVNNLFIQELYFCGKKADSKGSVSDAFMNVPEGVDEELPFN